MAGPIKLFQSVQNFYRGMGIYPPKVNQEFSFLLKRLFFGISSIITFLALIAFLLFEAQTIDEFISAFHGSMTELVQLSGFYLSEWRIPNILRLIENFESFIEKRKHRFCFGIANTCLNE